MRTSVVIPAFNRRGLLEQALESVRRQTLPPDEIVVVDDGSTDGTAEWLQTQPDVRTIRQPNAGAAKARNTGVREAAGDWIAFLDSDDLWDPRKLDLQRRALEGAPSRRWAICDSRAVDEGGNPLRGHHKPIRGGAVTGDLFDRTFIHTPSVLIERKLVLEAGGFDESLTVCEDLDLWLKASLRSEVIAVQEPLFIRRVHPASLAHTDDPKHDEDKCRVLERFAADPEAARVLNPRRVARRLARVHYRAARNHARRGNHGEAARHRKRARSLRPGNIRYWLPLRWLP